MEAITISAGFALGMVVAWMGWGAQAIKKAFSIPCDNG